MDTSLAALTSLRLQATSRPWEGNQDKHITTASGGLALMRWQAFSPFSDSTSTSHPDERSSAAEQWASEAVQ
jgi:hypothetical protein